MASPRPGFPNELIFILFFPCNINTLQCLPLCFLEIAPNATVEKRILGSTFPSQPLAERPDSRSAGGLTDVSLHHGSVESPKHVDPAQIVYQGEPRTRPLYIHFQFGPKREAVHTLLGTDVGEDRLDDTSTARGASVARRLAWICFTRVFYRLLS